LSAAPIRQTLHLRAPAARPVRSRCWSVLRLAHVRLAVHGLVAR